ncbi:MAG TPA: hypothetical protein VFU86_00030, partial [Terriglobales bacterium]|nr:hypothetical protein [Terriglobales bacterium]
MPDSNRLFYILEASDTFVYHYTSAKTLASAILPSEKLRFSRFSRTNDPFEYKTWEFGFGAVADLEGLDYERDQKKASEIAKRNSRVLCATMDDVSAVGAGIDKIYGRGFCRSRMWAQYAEKHT